MAKRPLTQKEQDRRRRVQWWHEARFGLFIQWGLYSVIGRKREGA